MTKAEIKKAIENGETLYQAFNNHVWGVSFLTYKGKANKEIHIIGDIIQVIIYGKNESVKNFRIDRLFKTKAEAEWNVKWDNRTKVVRFVDEKGNPPLPYEEFVKADVDFIIRQFRLHYCKINESFEIFDNTKKVGYQLMSLVDIKDKKQSYNLALEELYKRWKESL